MNTLNIRIFRAHRNLLLLAFVALFAVMLFYAGTWNGTAQENTPEPLLPLKPGMQERAVTQAFVNNLERFHISQRSLDTNLSKEAFRLYIKALDPRKMFFYQSDIDEFKAKYETRLSELIKQHPVDVRPAFEIYNRFLLRIQERVAMIQDILASPIDFTVDEHLVYDRPSDFTLDDDVVRERGLQTFPDTTDEASERWRKRIKGELLGMMAERITAEKKHAKDVAEGREPEEIDERDPVERLLRRYVSYQRRMLLEGRIDSASILASVRQQANDDVMELFLDAIAGALDPHSSYMSPSTEASFIGQIGKNFQGIGATLYTEDGYVVVRDVIKGSPADRSGEIRPKDRIQGVGQGRDGRIEEVIDFKIADVVKLIRGEKGTVVRLEVLPGGKGPAKIVEIVRDEIKLDDQAAHSEIFDAGLKPDGTPYRIGFIELPDFYFDMQAARQRSDNIRSATADVKKILNDFVAAEVDAVVLDLRYNGGGVLQEAIGITNLFLGAGVVVQVKDESNSRPQPRGTSDPSAEWTGPLVVLTNKFSASASEILAGAIQDYQRGLIVGDSTSHGKGTVQSVLDLNNRLVVTNKLGSGKITIQGYYRPSGFSPQGVGVLADIVLPSFTDAMEGIMESDLDNALTLQRVAAAPGLTPKQFVSPQIVEELRRRSNQRVAECEDFARQLERIAAYRDARARRITPLNKEKFIEEVNRFNTDEWEREEFEDLVNKERRVKRDYYIEEVLAITVDYLKAAQEFGIAFPKERTIRSPQRRQLLGGMLGF